MNKQAKKQVNRNREVYISGNNAVQLEQYVHPEKTVKTVVRKKAKTQTRRHQISNPIYTFVLISVIIATLVVTVVLLKTQFIVTDRAEQLIMLQQELVEIKKANSQIESDIKKSVNMDEVYRIATQELGMVQAGKDNIKYVQAKELTYTVQYADVTVSNEADEMNIGHILGFISKGW